MVNFKEIILFTRLNRIAFEKVKLFRQFIFKRNDRRLFTKQTLCKLSELIFVCFEISYESDACLQWERKRQRDRILYSLRRIES